MRLLLASTYELGRQPVHLASPQARLRASGVDTIPIDLSVDELSPDLLEQVDGVAFSVPMHTAMRLAVPIARRIKESWPELPIAFYGLYAAVGADENLGVVADALFTGEYEGPLTDWALRLGEPFAPIKTTNLANTPFLTPDRSGLSSYESYARLEWEGEARPAAAVEASHGCRHRCRHCPIPAVYDGRMRVVGKEPVLRDIDQLAVSGVRHVTFGDPDFLNAPRYSIDILREAHLAHPDMTFDVTVKVEHILRHRALWAEMADLGVLFVVSAFETVDPTSLLILDKGHTVADMVEAVTVLRSAGIHIRPTWLPFLPWTEPGHLSNLVRFIDESDLWGAIDPVQLAIKLLIPEGSLLEEHPAVVPLLDEYVPESLTWSWRFAHPETGRIHEVLEGIAANASDCGQEATETLEAIRSRIGELTATPFGTMPAARPAPRLTESWFCCAEPTASQAESAGLQIARVPVTQR
ncbi:MAG: radical SAM protein [Acidimicrobiia bacterium]